MAEKSNTEKRGLLQSFNECREKNKLLRILTNKYILVTIIFMAFTLFFTDNNIISWSNHTINVYKQNQLIRKYRQDIKNIEEDLLKLESNKDSIEKFAREQYYFQEKGEDVYILK